jgi:hypothetical protein
MIVARHVCALILLICLPQVVVAQTLSDRLRLIEGHLAAQQPAAALLEARRLYLSVAQTAGLQLGPPILVTGPAASLGVYEPRAGHVYTHDEPVLAYAEATGFTFQRQADGRNRVHLSMTFRLIDMAGRDRSGLVEMGEVDLSSRAEPMDVFINLTYRISGAKGPHVLHTAVTDIIGGSIATFDLPVHFQ